MGGREGGGGLVIKISSQSNNINNRGTSIHGHAVEYL